MENPRGDRGSGQMRGDFSYGEIVRSALRISWRNKFLWFFGLFVSGGLLSNFNAPSGLGGGQQNQNFPGLNQTFSDLQGAASSFTGSSSVTTGNLPGALALQAGPSGGTIALVVGVVVVAILLFLLFIALILISRGGLASSVAAIDGGEESRFGATWRAGLSNFWRVLLQVVLLFLISLGLLIVIFAVVGIPILLTFLLSESVGFRVAMTVIFILLGILLLIAVFIPFTIISQLALRDLVVGRNGISGSISGAYHLLRRNFGRGLLVWLLNIGLKLLVLVSTFIVILLLGLVLVGPGIAVSATGNPNTGLVLGIIGGVLLLIPILIITGATGTYFHTYWTLAYLRMRGVEGATVPAQSPETTYTDSEARTTTDDASDDETGDDEREDRPDERRDL